MKIADLAAAQAISTERAVNTAMRDRIASGEVLALMIGQGSEAREIVLSPGYLAGIRAELIAAFDARIAANESSLRALGVEP